MYGKRHTKSQFRHTFKKNADLAFSEKWHLNVRSHQSAVSFPPDTVIMTSSLTFHDVIVISRDIGMVYHQGMINKGISVSAVSHRNKLF